MIGALYKHDKELWGVPSLEMLLLPQPLRWEESIVNSAPSQPDPSMGSAAWKLPVSPHYVVKLR